MHDTAPPTPSTTSEAGAQELSPAAGEQQSPRWQPRVWVGSWLDYNNGQLHGAWIDADQEDDEIQADVQAMLAASPTTATTGEPAEDWGIFDSLDFGGLRLDEQEPLTWIGAVGRGVARHGPAFAAYAGIVAEQLTPSSFEEDYLGTWSSLGAYVESFAEDAGYNRLLDDNLPDSIRGYVRLDTAAIARDMQAGGAVHVEPLPDGQVAIFSA